MQRIKQAFSQSNSVKGATVILVVTLFISNILGVIRDHFLAQKIPTSILDTYYAAFRIPDLVFNMLILGAIAAAFIPVFTSYRIKNEKEAWYITNSFLNFAVLAVLVSGIILYFLMPSFINFIVSDFTQEKLTITINLARILLISPVFFSLSYIMGGVLNSYKKFLIYSMAPLVYNLSIILATIFLADKFQVYGVVYGVIVGAFLHFIVQLPSVIKLGFKYQFIFDWMNEGVRKIIILMIPRAIGLGALQIMLLVFTAIAATIGAGSVAMFNLADNIQTMPTVVFGTSFATALFPVLSEKSSQNKIEDFNKYLADGLRAILFILIPASIGVIMLRTEIVRVILGSGHFGWQQTVVTANVLGVFAISLFAQGLIPLFSRAFYALHNTKTPTIISIISIFISIMLGYIFVNSLGVLGLALAFSIGSIVNFSLLYIIFRRHSPKIKKQEIGIYQLIIKVIFASIIMAIFIQITKTVFGSIVDMQRFWGVFAKLLASIIIPGAIYLYICHLYKCEEINHIKEILGKKFGLITNDN